MKVLAAVGTRPEAIKMAPVLLALRRRRGLRVRLCATAQHRELLDMALSEFGLRPDVDLDAMRRAQSLAGILRRVRAGFSRVLERERPGLVLVQGDTIGALAAAAASAEAGVPVAHVEAGLRSFDRKNPFPEEDCRVMIDALSTLHFAPTRGAAENLRREGFSRSVLVTGNTGIDALAWALRRARPPRRAGKTVAVTLHRRESFGRPLRAIFAGLVEAAERLPEYRWRYPVHPNPRVRLAARRWLRHPRIELLPPLGYRDFVALLRAADFIVTDSGGIQEEAPTLGKAVIVVRRKTERPELLRAGGVLVGHSRKRLLRAILDFAAGRRPAVPRRNPFGDGRAAERIAAAVARFGIMRSGR